MFDSPDAPQPRTVEQQRAYLDALEQERDEYRRHGNEARAAVCDAELEKERAAEAEAERGGPDD